MRTFAEASPDPEIVQQVVAQSLQAQNRPLGGQRRMCSRPPQCWPPRAYLENSYGRVRIFGVYFRIWRSHRSRLRRSGNHAVGRLSSIMAFSCEDPMSHRIHRFRYFGRRSDLPCSGTLMGLRRLNNLACGLSLSSRPLDCNGFLVLPDKWNRVPEGIETRRLVSYIVATEKGTKLWPRQQWCGHALPKT